MNSIKLTESNRFDKESDSIVKENKGEYGVDQDKEANEPRNA